MTVLNQLVQWLVNHSAELGLALLGTSITFFVWIGRRLMQWGRRKHAERRRRKAAEDWIEFLEGYDGNL